MRAPTVIAANANRRACDGQEHTSGGASATASFCAAHSVAFFDVETEEHALSPRFAGRAPRKRLIPGASR